MKPIQATGGAAMIMVVMFTLLLMAGILAASLRLTLGSRQSTADQAATLKAQYAAESGMALAQSRLRDIQQMLSQAGTNSNVGIYLPPGTKTSDVSNWANLLCSSGSGTWSSINEGRNNSSGFYDPVTEKNFPNAQDCKFNPSAPPTDYTLLANIVNAASYAVLPAAERPAATIAGYASFWRDVFAGTSTLNVGSLGTVADTQLRITRIVRMSPIRHRIYLKVFNISVSGSGIEGSTSAKRVLDAQSSNGGGWWFDITQPSLLDAVVQDDFHGEVNFTTTTNFQGPIKTNDVFTFTSSAGYNSPSFSGQISSAGCTTRTTLSNGEPSCIRNPGVRINSNLVRSFNGTTDAQKSTNIRNYIANNGVSVNYNDVTPDFASSYQPFPTISLAQENAARGLDEAGNTLADGSRGLLLSNSDVGIELIVGDGSMNQPTTYDLGTRTWQEASSTYQYIRPVTSNGCTDSFNTTCTPTYGNTIYRVDADSNIFSKTGTGAWSPLGYKFNGVIFKSGTANDTPLSVFGPKRIAGTTPESQARPAIASFMGITIATARTLDIRTDLALSQSPCRFDEYEAASANTAIQPKCGNRRNVLGLFSSAGKVVLKKQVPNNAVLQAAVMSSQDEVTVEAFKQGSDRGTLYFTGSMVEKIYGANGTFTQGYNRCTRQDWWGRCLSSVWVPPTSSGYSREYSHDKRFLEGLSPPFYPVSPKWEVIDASRDGQNLDRLIFKQGKS